MVNIKVPALRYHGAKFKISQWINTKLPPHKVYVEPFGGSGAVLLTKDKADIEVYNDLDASVVTFFRVLRSRPDELIQQIELTPFSRAEFELSIQPVDDELEQARRVYVRSWQAHVPILNRLSGWRNLKINFESHSTVGAWNRIDHLWAITARLKEIQIECKPALEIIQDYDSPNTLHFVDPPYVLSARRQLAKDGYRHEMTDGDHMELAEALHRIQGMVILCGYKSDLYDHLYKDWHCESKTTTTSRASKAIECLWLNAATLSATRQLQLF